MSVSGFVCYCPELRLYHYHVEDTSKSDASRIADLKFDDDGLEDGIATDLAEGREDQAKLMASITAMARAQPHKFVCFDASKEELDPVDPKAYWKKHDDERDALEG